MARTTKRVQFKIKINEDGSYYDFFPGLVELMQHLVPGTYQLILDQIPDNLQKAKARYFAMVSELATFAGYHSRKDKELFKEQIKQELGNESLAEMTDIMQVGIKIEELHQLAANHYNYQFTPYEPNA